MLEVSFKPTLIPIKSTYKVTFTLYLYTKKLSYLYWCGTSNTIS